MAGLALFHSSPGLDLFTPTRMSSKTKECPGCAMDVDDDATACPICGYEFPERPRWIIWLAVVLLVAILWLWIF